MANAGFMFVTANGVAIDGDSVVVDQDREHSIQIVEVRHEVNSPGDRNSGRVTGHRLHHPIAVTARVDRATPLMYQAWAHRHHCEVDLRFWKRTEDVQEEVEYFKIHLEAAHITGITMEWPNSTDVQQSQRPETVIYFFAYESITWIHVDGNLEFRDTWHERE